MNAPTPSFFVADDELDRELVDYKNDDKTVRIFEKESEELHFIKGYN
ncbi:MAG: hypothetical protein ACI9LM_003728 [Alteromonadaceae bacterium]|jgi:hypothetical protein